MRLLIVEDTHSLVINLFEYFEARGHVLDAAPDGMTGLHLALANAYDALVVDWGLPRLDGVELVRRLRDVNISVPIILLTARDDLADKLTGFRAGADDYLTKPFAIAELEIRLQSLLSRGPSLRTRVLRIADLELDLGTLTASRAGIPIRLYPACRKLLETLIRASPDVVSRQRLEHVLWGDAPPERDVLRSQLYELRRAVDGPFQRKLIHTVAREGYWIGVADDA